MLEYKLLKFVFLFLFVIKSKIIHMCFCSYLL